MIRNTLFQPTFLRKEIWIPERTCQRQVFSRLSQFWNRWICLYIFHSLLVTYCRWPSVTLMVATRRHLCTCWSHYKLDMTYLDLLSSWMETGRYWMARWYECSIWVCERTTLTSFYKLRQKAWERVKQSCQCLVYLQITTYTKITQY